MHEHPSPVVLFFYNRPDHLQRVLACIIKAKPAGLYLVSDGPQTKQDEKDVLACRQIADAPAYPFPVFRKYADHNLGVARSIPEGLEWIFDHEPKAIILEDDVLPQPAFFHYMNEMLVRYETDERIDLIMGHQLTPLTLSDHQYFFTRFCLPPWGWATWGKKWQTYDYQMSTWPTCRKYLGKDLNLDFWSPILERNQRAPRSWDIQWNFWLWHRHTLAVAPAKSLTTNIGFGPKATFTKLTGSEFSKVAPENHHDLNWELIPDAQRMPYEQMMQERIMALIREVMHTQH